MEAGLGREVSVTVAEAINGDDRWDGVERQVTTSPMTEDGAR